MTKKAVPVVSKNVRASRRDFVKRAAYVPPAILTLAVAPRYAKAGSDKKVKDKN